MKHHAHQFEADFGAEPFALVQETANDQERMDRERQAKREAQHEADKFQSELWAAMDS